MGKICNKRIIMMFEEWIEKFHNINHKRFELRHPETQRQMYEEFNKYQVIEHESDNAKSI